MRWPWSKKIQPPPPPSAVYAGPGSSDPFFWLNKALTNSDPQEVANWRTNLQSSLKNAQESLDQYEQGRMALALLDYVKRQAPEMLAEFERVYTVRQALKGKR